jgi:hypothetical protein
MSIWIGLLVIVVVTVAILMMLGRGRLAASRRQLPGPDLAPRSDADTSFLYVAGMAQDQHASHQHHVAADCTPSHDSGSSCSTDAGSSDGGSSGGH